MFAVEMPDALLCYLCLRSLFIGAAFLISQHLSNLVMPLWSAAVRKRLHKHSL